MNTDYRAYRNRPLVLPVAEAHAQGIVSYAEDGTVRLVYQREGIDLSVSIPLERQYSAVLASFQDLNKALSQTANSPRTTDGKSLRERFDEEMARYEMLLEDHAATDAFGEPDYGTYVYDQIAHELFLILPEFWHRLGLVTNNSKLLTDPEGKLSWHEIRTKFDNATIGVVGASVGGNLVEGIMREIRPKRMKLADYDWVELTNLNRFERGSFRHLVSSKAERFDPKNPYDVVRVNKAELTAYMHQMIDPYSEWYVYPEGLLAENIERFLIGGDGEPKLDLFIEECDDLRMKVELRKLCRKHGIPVLMLSDFGHHVQVQFQDYRSRPESGIGYRATDQQVEEALETAMTSGKREDRFDFIRLICGDDFAQDEFGEWVEARGEQPTSSLPQSGATAMTSGGIGGKIVALSLLGYPIPERFIYDLKHHRVLP